MYAAQGREHFEKLGVAERFQGRRDADRSRRDDAITTRLIRLRRSGQPTVVAIPKLASVPTCKQVRNFSQSLGNATRIRFERRRDKETLLVSAREMGQAS